MERVTTSAPATIQTSRVRGSLPLNTVFPLRWLYSRGNTVFGGKLPRTRPVWMVAGALVVTLSIVAFYVLRPSAQSARTGAAFSEFLHDVQNGRVKRITQSQDALEFDLADGSRHVTIAPQGYVASNPSFVTDLAQRGII